MNLLRVKGILLQELYFSFRAIEIVMDLAVFPLMTIIVFGFLSKYLAGTDPVISKGVLAGMLLWQFIWITQYTVALGSLWNIWSRNLSNLFVSPLTVSEFIFAQTLSGILKGLLILLLGSILSFYVYNFNILEIGIINLTILSVNLVLFAFTLGMIVLGLIFRFGLRIQSFAWGLLPIFQPLTAAFYPVTILPKPLQVIAYLLPPTYVFEAIRGILRTSYLDLSLMGVAFLLNIIYVSSSIIFFRYMFNKSKESGQFARNEG